MSLYSISIKTIIIKTRNKGICFPVRKLFCYRGFVSDKFYIEIMFIAKHGHDFKKHSKDNKLFKIFSYPFFET